MSTIFQAVWLALFIIFVFSVVTSGITAKKIDNIHEPSYAKAFLATALKNVTSLAGFFLFGLFLQAPWFVALAIAYSLIPIFVYKVVFSSQWSEAAWIWIVALIVEVGVGYGLTLVGVLSLGGVMQA